MKVIGYHWRCFTDWLKRWIYAQHNARVLVDTEWRLGLLLEQATGGQYSKSGYTSEVMAKAVAEYHRNLEAAAFKEGDRTGSIDGFFAGYMVARNGGWRDPAEAPDNTPVRLLVEGGMTICAARQHVFQTDDGEILVWQELDGMHPESWPNGVCLDASTGVGSSSVPLGFRPLDEGEMC